jgi:Ca-activated chloride channel family protein
VALLAAAGGGASAGSSLPARRPTEGTLAARDGRALVDVPLRHTGVRIEIAAFLADVRVEQTFVNPYEKKIDAVYMFPLPSGAAVSEMEIESGGRAIHGHIDRRAEARRTYERARGEGQVAALLIQERPNLFVQSVANLEPRAEVVVRLRYVQPLAYEAGGYEVVFPMVAGPRGPAAGPAPPVVPAGVRSSHEIGIETVIDGGAPVTGIVSPSHRIAVDGDHVTLAEGDTVPNKDFILRWRAAGARPELALLAHRPPGAAAGTFFLLAQPPERAAAAEVTPREMVFVVDTSSSMAGAPLAKAKEVVRRALGAMGPDDTFQIVRFDDRAGALGDRPLASRRRNVELALGWLAALEAGGGTDMMAGIAAALGFPHDPARLRMVVFLTDGYIGNEDEVLRLVAARLGPSRIFSFGIGSAVNRWLLEEMAALGRGAAEVVRPDEDTRAAVERLGRRIGQPLLTDVRIDWGGLDVADVVPAAVPDLFAGQPLVVAGRYRRPGAATVTLHALRAGEPVELRLPVSLPAEDDARPAVGSVWARARIAELARRQIRGDTPALREEITAIALEHHLMSPYTAFVAVDPNRATAGGPGETVVVPVEVPEGVRRAGVLTLHAVGYGGGYGAGEGYGAGAMGVVGKSVGESHAGVAMGRALYPALVVADAGAMVVGARDIAIIKRVFDLHRNEVRFCYELSLQKAPDLAGRLVLEVEIATDGHVAAGRVRESSLADDEVGRCVVEAARRWSFPAVSGDRSDVVHYPFVFKRSEEQKP